MSERKNDNLDLEKCLAEAEEFHGDTCGGINMGTRMAIRGMREIGILDPKGKDSRDIMVFVEIDRCPTDAIIAVTGCHPGKHTLKILDYGKMAATFINLKTKKAVRVCALNRHDRTGSDSVKDDFAILADDELFTVSEVSVIIKPEDMPGKPLRSVICESCGESVLDKKDIEKEGRFYCKPCAERKNYYTGLK